MKFLIASDIHGSERSAERIRKLYTEGSFDKLLLLGDLLYHGPRNDLPPSYNPKKVIEILSTLKDEIISVRGNCEAEVDQMVLPFPVLSESSVVFADGYTIFMTHGHIHTFCISIQVPSPSRKEAFLQAMQSGITGLLKSGISMMILRFFLTGEIKSDGDISVILLNTDISFMQFHYLIDNRKSKSRTA